MTLYPQSDIGGLSTVPGCDQNHYRPVNPRTGKPQHPWGIDCPAHQAYYTGQHRPKVLKYVTDKKTGQVISQQRVLDVDPRFSTTPDTIPLTYDEENTRERKLEMGENQLRALEALLTLKGGGVDLTSRPEVMYFLQESGLPPEMLQGKTVCANGHDNAAGNKHCPECGISMAARDAIAPPEAPEIDLARLHPQTLKKMCREKSLPDNGNKDVLIGRLQAA